MDEAAPAERAARLRDLGIAKRFDFAALLWMVFVLIGAGVQAYDRVNIIDRYPPEIVGRSGGWAKVAAIGSSCDYLLALACIAGVACAWAVDGRAKRTTYWLGALGTAWICVCGVLEVAAAVHGTRALQLFVGSNRGAAAAFGVVNFGAGLVVLLAILWLLASDRTLAAAGEPELAEVS